MSGESDFVLLSQAQEITLGQQQHSSILQQYGDYSHTELQAYVSEVGQRLASVSHRDDLVYRFTLLDSPEVNAFALPGGYVYVNRGLLAYLNSEAELAAVLGHEIGHVAARHGVRQYSTAMATGFGTVLGSLFVPELRQRGGQDLLNVLSTALLRGYGREHELEADRLGAEYLARAGYDPHAMIQVIRVLKHQEQFEQQAARRQNREPQVYHGVFATHPDNDQRLHEVVATAEHLTPPGAARGEGRATFLARLQGLVFGPPAREGVLRGQVFYHGTLDIGLRFPPGWHVANLPDRLLAAAPEQAAVLQVELAEPDRPLTPEQFLKKRFKGSALREGEVISDWEWPTHTALVSLDSPWGRREGRVFAVARGQQLYLFTGMTSAVDGRPGFDAEFRAVARSLHGLSEAERLWAEPLRLQITTALPDSSFSRLAEESPISHYAVEQLRLLNDYYPTGEPVAGEAIKVVH